MIVMNIAQHLVRKILKVIHVTLHNKCKLLQLKKLDVMITRDISFEMRATANLSSFR